MKKKDLKYDFLPSYLEVIEKPPNPAGNIIILIIAILIIGLITLSYLFKIDIKVNTIGQVNPINGLSIVNTNLTGKIVSIDKKVGDKVKQGDVILSVENKDIQKNIDSINETIEEKNLDLAIAKNKVNGKASYNEIQASSLSEGVKQEIKIEQELFWENKNQDDARYKEQLKEINTRISKTNDGIKELQEEYDNLADPDVVLKGDLILEDIESDKEQLEKLNKERESIISSKEKSNKQYKLDLTSQVNQLNEDLSTLKEQLKNANEKSVNLNVVAPADGTILSMNYNTIGSYLETPSIAEIVPENSKCEVVTTIDNQYISKVEIGQKALVKIDAYDFQEYGGLDGTISYISPTAVLDEKTGKAVYQIKIEYVNQNPEITVLPGMLSNVEINVDRVRLIEYILSPFSDIFEKAF